MRSFCLLSFILSLFLLSCTPTLAQPPTHSRGHEQSRARHRRTTPLRNLTYTAHKRDPNAAFTYFVDGQGACGATNGPNDFIVALNSAEYGGGSHCFEMITIIIDGKTAQAQITDECPGCSPGGLDFSQGLFQYFAPLSQGELYGAWYFNNDLPTSTSTPPPPPTTTSSTSTWTPPPTTSTSSTLSVASSTTTSSPSPTSTMPTIPTSTPQGPQIILQVNLALLELGSLLQASLTL